MNGLKRVISRGSKKNPDTHSVSPFRLSFTSDGIDWISVFAKDWNKTKVISDSEGLLAAWERLQASGETIDKTSITCLAKTYGKTSGKWLFFVKTGDKVGSVWAKVAKAVVSGDLCYCAKISPFDPSGSGSHVCCMYNDDFTNEDEVMALEQRIRDSGIYTTLLYKPDVYTCLGIYKQKNEWNVRPTIYESNFEVVSRQSKVITN
ncbi:UPF0696 protein C11orf68 homolog [Lineus longissimus]|uniref:UPF0696 protein C11orf68 homolog n=1 Tax=Lineus longissimus TaxID=88925 RepID=UPI00315CBFF4